MSLRHARGVLAKELRSEGIASVVRRIADRVVLWSEDARVPRARLDTLPGALAGPRTGGAAYPLLNVLSGARHFRSGLPLVTSSRLAAEAALRPLAVLAPTRRGWSLHLQRGADRARMEIEESGAPFRLDLPSRPCAAVVGRVMDALGSSAVHVDGVHGLAMDDIAALGASRALLLTLVDFALYSPRPHLIDSSSGVFCGYSSDAARCALCLADESSTGSGRIEHHRRRGRAVLQGARTVIFLSPFLRDQHLALFPGVDPARHHVVAPCGAAAVRFDTGDRPDPRRVAFVGAFNTQKGAGVFLDLVQRTATPGPGPVEWLIAAGGDASWIAKARELPSIRVHGFYRPGHLPRMLRRSRTGVALLLSISPESYSQTLSECFTAGVPIIAFDHGSVAERVRAANRGVDRLVPLAAGARGVQAALEDFRRYPPRDWQPAIEPQSPAECAREYAAVYRAAGLLQNSEFSR